jgi:DTW domain-containing protein YfiP
LAPTLHSRATFLLITHQRETDRATNTGKLIQHALQSTQVWVWERNDPLPPAVKALLQTPKFKPWLVFPADRPELKQQAGNPNRDTGAASPSPLFILLDGTWKEARKIYRKTPWLQEIPLLSLPEPPPSRYRLRRKSDHGHLCTAEVAIELFKTIHEPHQARQLDDYFSRFVHHYEAYRDHFPDPEGNKING